MTNQDWQQLVPEAAAKILEADAIWIGAGAGMGVDSGLPDFRGDAGFWKAYPPFQKLGLSFIDLANPRWFKHDKHRAWGFYGHRLMLYRETQPHKGFEILKKWAESRPLGGFVFTSNVDGHFQASGFDDSQIIECHGAINRFQCAVNCTDDIWSGQDVTVNIDAEFRAIDPLPECPHCHRVARPNILMFGDWTWNEQRVVQQESNYLTWLTKCIGKKRVSIEIGAGLAIPTVRREAEKDTDTLIRINPRDPHGPQNCLSFPVGGLEALTAIDAEIAKIQRRS